ncbi:MAG: hypothetical protein M9927_03035 [Anaerolineae bacterium]|nr:hypothetical protein [Anaerolineae bacterium]
MAKCQVCGRGPQFGHNVSHSMRHTSAAGTSTYSEPR